MAGGLPQILIIDTNPERAALLELGLREAGYREVVRLDDLVDLVPRIVAIDPDVILIDLENPNRDTVEQMFRISREVKRPIAMFSDDDDPATIRAAVRAGVSVYVVDGPRRDRLRHVVELAISRFELHRELEARAVRAEAALEERKLVDRAKGILMNRRNLSEQEAYTMLRRTARNRGRRLADVAHSIVTAEDVGVL